MKAYQHLVRYALATAQAVSVWDGEGWATDKSTDYQEIIEAIESVEEAELVIFDRETGSRTAWARVAAFGLADDETVIDYTVNDFTTAWEAAYERATA